MLNLIIATICFSLSFGLIKTQLASLPSDFVVLSRLFLAFLIFIPFIKKGNLKKQYLAFLIGIIQFGIMFFCFLKAFKYLQGNEIALLTTTTPIFVGLWATLFGERFRLIYIICILLSILGAGIIVWQNISFDMIVKGILLMETSNCAFALGQILWKKCVDDTSPKYMPSAYLGATLFVLPFTIANNSFQIIHSITLNQVLSILYLALIPTGIGFFLWNKGAIQVSSSVLAIMNNLKIPFAILFSIIIFQEKINIQNFIIGSSIILFSIFLLNNQLKK